MRKLLRALPLLTAIIVSNPLLASASKEEGDPNAPAVSYVELAPSFVANYQAAKIRYLKADVTLKVMNAGTADAVLRHQPLIRNNLVMLFSRQTEESLASPEGRQHLKEEALQEVVKALESEKEPVDISEVLFTTFILD